MDVVAEAAASVRVSKEVACHCAEGAEGLYGNVPSRTDYLYVVSVSSWMGKEVDGRFDVRPIPCREGRALPKLQSEQRCGSIICYPRVLLVLGPCHPVLRQSTHYRIW